MPLLKPRPSEQTRRVPASQEAPGGGSGGCQDRLRATLRRRVLGLELRVALVTLPLLLWELYERVSRTPGTVTHQPDSRYYMVMALRDLGVPLAHAITQSYGQMAHVSLESWYFAHNDPGWAMVSSRILYPALSAPFVALLGLNLGMMVVPVVSVVVTVLATARTVQRVHGPVAAVVSVGALTTSVVFTRQYVVAYTDPVAVAVMALLLCNLPFNRRASGRNLVFAAFLVVMGDLTRQIGPVPAGMVLAPWLWTALRERRLRNRWTSTVLVVGGTAVAAQAALALAAPFNVGSTFAELHHAYTLGAEVRSAPRLFLELLWQNASFAGRADPVLLVLMAAALLFCALRFRSESTAVFLGAFLGTELLGLLSVMSFLRYEMVAFPALCLAAGGAVAVVTGWGHEEPGYGPESEYLPESKPEPESKPAERGNESRWDQPLRWSAALLLCGLLTAGLLGWSVSHSPTTAAVAEYPSVRAAQGDHTYARTPVAVVPAQRTLTALFGQLLRLRRHPTATRLGPRITALDWVHQVRYRPTDPDAPGWRRRAGDGTADFALYGLQNVDLVRGLTDSLTFDGTIVPRTVHVLDRSTSRYGEDVAFTVRDTTGAVHRGVATTLYPTRSTKAPGVVTRIVFQDTNP